MKKSHRKDVIIARIIFAAMCIVLLAVIISLGVWLHGRKAEKNAVSQVSEQQNNLPAVQNTELPPVTENPVEETETCVWTNTGVNLREQPNTDCRILTILEEGAELTLLGEEDGWVNVSYNDVEGYVSAEYVTDVNPAGTTEE